MGRAPCCEKESVKRGPWTPEEDAKLLSCVAQHGTGSWRTVPKKAGLQRCGKSCRLRWTNYLRPDLKHGRFSDHEEQTIVRLHAALGSRWSLIAAQLPGRTDNDVKNYWNTRLKKKLCEMGIDPITHKPISQLLADLAGSMAVPVAGSSMPTTSTHMVGGRTIAEAALGCFKDEMLNVIMRRNPNTMVQQHHHHNHHNHPSSSSSPNLSLVSAPPQSVDHMSSLSLSFQQRPSSFTSSGSGSANANGFFAHGFEHDQQLINNSKPLMHMLLESTPVTPTTHHMASSSSQYAFHRPDTMGAQMRQTSSFINNNNNTNSNNNNHHHGNDIHLPMASHNLATSSITFPAQMQLNTPTTTSTSTTSASTNFSTLSLAQSAEKFLQANPTAVQPWPQLVPDQQEEEEEEEEEGEEEEESKKRRLVNNSMEDAHQELNNIASECHWRGDQQLNEDEDEDDEINQLRQFSNTTPPITYNINSSSPTSLQSRMNTSVGAISNMSWSSCPSACTSRSSSTCSNFLPSAPSNSHDACINNYSHITGNDSDHKYNNNDSNNPTSSIANNEASVDAMIWDLSDLNALI